MPTLTFTSELDLRAIRGKYRAFKLIDNLNIEVDECPGIIPSGFVTDLASVPKLFQNIVTNNDQDILCAAVVHDYLYQNGGQLWDGVAPFTRKHCDVILKSGMESLGATRLKRNLVYLTVRSFGWLFWAPSRTSPNTF